jgi:hypothetical protein
MTSVHSKHVAAILNTVYKLFAPSISWCGFKASLYQGNGSEGLVQSWCKGESGELSVYTSVRDGVPVIPKGL